MSDLHKTTVGRVVFGPNPMHPMQDRWRDLVLAGQASVLMSSARPCNCIGPQAGQTKCPCALRVEMEKAGQMVREGVVIDGRRYRLVPED